MLVTQHKKQYPGTVSSVIPGNHDKPQQCCHGDNKPFVKDGSMYKVQKVNTTCKRDLQSADFFFFFFFFFSELGCKMRKQYVE